MESMEVALNAMERGEGSDASRWSMKVGSQRENPTAQFGERSLPIERGETSVARMRWSSKVANDGDICTPKIAIGSCEDSSHEGRRDSKRLEGQAHNAGKQAAGQNKLSRGDRPASKGFEVQAHNAKLTALLVAALHKISGILGVMALTWATVVLLGGFVSSLSIWDFYLISSLLLAESFRLFIIQIFIKLVSRILYRERTDPTRFEFTDKQPELVSFLNFLGQTLSAGVAFVCLLFIYYRIGIRGSPPFDGGPKHLAPALWIFYMILILNFMIAIASAVLHLLFRSSQRRKEKLNGGKDMNSLTTFFDTIYRTAIEEGMTKAGEVDLLDFAFNKIASDLKRNIRPLVVSSRNREMIRHMYGNVGIVMTCQYMKGDDLWKRLAAANLPGFWKDEDRIETKQELFWSLRDRVFGAGDDASASLNSIESLARSWAVDKNRWKPHPFLIDSPVDHGGKVFDTIVMLLLMETRSPLHFRIRAFEACCRDHRVLEYLYKQSAPNSEQPMDKGLISRCLHEIVLNEVRQQELPVEKEVKNHEGDRGGNVGERDTRCNILSNSKLAELCIKLVKVLSPTSRARIFAKIYSARALMLLLQHGDKNRECEAAQPLKEWVDGSMKLEPTGTGRISYYMKDHIQAAENVRMWLELSPLEWSSVKVVDMDNGLQELKSDEINAIVLAVRNRSSAQPAGM
ncbi:hypothetical protein KP509_20G063900 [Ceratopteris richardii]|uniref:Uncharacterized protein n=1 Tax=Ceratopteris richardii TaxID=49495 RepID=A0A8T2SJ15_CERRI|nr:hypothetical protein KP509_20G063900 [Ceratopteris richardii]